MKKKKILKTLIYIALAGALLTGGYTAVRAYQSPLAPMLSLPAPVEAVELPAPAEVKSAVIEPQTPAGVCGQTGSLTILFIGSDSSFGNPPYGADSVRLIKVDYDAQTVTSIAFPRDMIVDTAALDDASITEQPLGLTFYHAKNAAAGSGIEKNASAAQVMAEVMLDDFSVRADNYITVEMDSVADMIDTIGGVEVTLSEAITTERNVTFNAGKQTLDGSLATEFVRAIQPGGDVARVARQNEFVKNLQDKVISASILPKVPTLLSQFKDAIVTDLSPEQLVSFACLAEIVEKESVEFITLKDPEHLAGATPNVDAIKALLAEKIGQ